MKYKIGVDIGGTNTDAVLIDSNHNCIKAAKTATTQDISQGFATVVQQVWTEQEPITGVFAGTTHAINSILEAKNLCKVGVLRLAGYQPDTLPSCFGWPDKLKQAVLHQCITLDGGYECDGREITPLNEYATRCAIETLANSGAQGIAVNGIFSALYPPQEQRVRQWIMDDLGNDFPITLSHEIGGIGFVERENAAILNTALQNNLKTGFIKLQDTLKKIGIHSPFYLVQNSGLLMSVEEAFKFPILTIAAGPKNSFTGGARLAGLEHAVVADIGGTSTDVGMIVNGYPRRSYKMSKVANIQLGFYMPDMLSIALGGGSCLTINDGLIQIGPVSVGSALRQRSRSFGGDQLTLTDAAIALGSVSINDVQQMMDKPLAEKVLIQAFQRVYQLYEKMAGANVDLPFVLVGGGASLIPSQYLSPQVILPPHWACANAYGAALSEMGATINTVIKLEDRSRLMKEYEQQVLSQAEQLGAVSPRIIEREVIPYHYSADKIAKLVMTAAGAYNPS